MPYPAFIPLPHRTAAPESVPCWQWDIFCTVIDNYGDAGVCWRLAAGLAERGQRVRLWIDQPDCLRWMAPDGAVGVDVRYWMQPLDITDLPQAAGDVLIEAFGCTLEAGVQAWWAGRGSAPGLWLNLEYLSAEAYVARCHGLPSPVMQGPAAGQVKQFYYPGFTADTGGLLRELCLAQEQQKFKREPLLRSMAGSDASASLCLESPNTEALTVSLFCYEPAALSGLLEQLASQPSTLLVFQGRSHQELLRLLGTNALPQHHDKCRLHMMLWLDQAGFDQVLWNSHLNFVRGEDSLVRALWAGQPFVWHIYPQDDDAHHAKLEAFLDWLQAPADLRLMHRIWNGISSGPLPSLTPERLQIWQACVQTARARLFEQEDLVSQLLRQQASGMSRPRQL